MATYFLLVLSVFLATSAYSSYVVNVVPEPVIGKRNDNMKSYTKRARIFAPFLYQDRIIFNKPVRNGIVHGECPDGWTTFQRSCYHFGHSSLTFIEAEQFCSHLGAHLVHIDDAAENTFIKSYLGDLKDPNHWIGLKDDVIEGRWTWYDTDTVATFTSWDPSQPNDGKGANCAAIWSSFAYNWVDEPCTRLFKPLCEKRNVKSGSVETVG